MAAVQTLVSDPIRKASRPPIEVLREKAVALEAETNGVLRGEVGEFPRDDDGFCRLYFNITTPALGSSRHGALLVAHRVEAPYPAVVDAQVLRINDVPRVGEWMHQGLDSTTMPDPDVDRANSDEELAAIVKRVFESPYIVSVMESRIARAAGQAPPG